MKDRQHQIDALIAAARAECDGSAESISLLVGAITIMCAKSNDPVAVLNIVIGSLTTARDLALRIKAAS